MAYIWDLNALPHLSERQYVQLPIHRKCGDVVAFGGNLSPGLLLSAYAQGLFPWYNEGEEILWWSPKQRCILIPKELHTSRSLIKTLRRNILAHPLKSAALRWSIDEDFGAVIRECAQTPRKPKMDEPGQNADAGGAGATWISGEMQRAYIELHELGYAHSVECRRIEDGRLIGGLYGVSLGRCFFGESMFSRERDASKMAFAIFVLFLKNRGFALIDCQQKTAHLERFGARCVPRSEFLQRLSACRPKIQPGQKAIWQTFARQFRLLPDSYLVHYLKQ